MSLHSTVGEKPNFFFFFRLFLFFFFFFFLFVFFGVFSGFR